MGSENMFSKLCGNSIDTETAIREREKMNGSSDLVPTDAIVKPQIYITTGAKEAAVKAAKALGLNTYCRVDVLLDKEGNCYCLEANTLPGMTPTSLLPQEAKAMGIDYSELCELLIEVSINKNPATK